MNYYNPYFMMNPGNLVSHTNNLGFFGRNGITLGSILNGTQRTLGVINQAIPLIRQAAPMFKNAKTMFKVMNEFKKVDTPTEIPTNNEKQTSNEKPKEINEMPANYSGPTFFL